MSLDIPNEVINIIFEYLNDIDVNISFGLIKKIDINKYYFLDVLFELKKKKNLFITTNNDDIYVYKYIDITESKYYRIITIVSELYNTNEIITELCDNNLPLFSVKISNNYY